MPLDNRVRLQDVARDGRELRSYQAQEGQDKV